jgi:flagellar basal-body rod protein FlgB
MIILAKSDNIKADEDAIVICEKNSFAKCLDRTSRPRYKPARERHRKNCENEMLEEIDLFRLTGDRMRYLTERQSVIAKNIANADTPGYQAQDSTPFTFDSALLRTGTSVSTAGRAAPLTLASTEPGHIAPSPASAAASSTKANAYGEKPDGNTVSLEEQMVKSADIGNGFSLASAAYTKSMTLMKIAIDSGK